MAESVAIGAGQKTNGVGRSQDRDLQDSFSLKQVIDRIEKRLSSSLKSSTQENTNLPEELDVLDIEAELGRPDEDDSDGTQELERGSRPIEGASQWGGGVDFSEREAEQTRKFDLEQTGEFSDEPYGRAIPPMDMSPDRPVRKPVQKVPAGWVRRDSETKTFEPSKYDEIEDAERGRSDPPQIPDFSRYDFIHDDSLDDSDETGKLKPPLGERVEAVDLAPSARERKVEAETSGTAAPYTGADAERSWNFQGEIGEKTGEMTGEKTGVYKESEPESTSDFKGEEREEARFYDKEELAGPERFDEEVGEKTGVYEESEPEPTSDFDPEAREDTRPYEREREPARISTSQEQSGRGTAETGAATPEPSRRKSSSDVPPRATELRLSRGFCSRGELGDDPLWTLLCAAYSDRVTGTLLLEHLSAERTIHIDKGEVLLASSTAFRDRLVELLYKEGRLSDDEYSQASLAVEASGRRVGAILVEQGFITSRELYPLVRHHYETMILDSFEWRSGTWRFEPSYESLGERIVLNVATPMIILEGLRSRARIDDVFELVPVGTRPLELGEGICRFDEVGLLPEEVAVINSLDGVMTVEETASRSNLPEEELRRLVAGLSVLGLVDLGLSRDEDDTVVTSSEKAHRHDFRVERSRVAYKMAQIQEGSYFAILETSPKSSGYEIRKAYRSLKGQFAIERFAVPELVDLHEHVELIRFVLDEAYEVLRNASLRETYRQTIKDGL